MNRNERAIKLVATWVKQIGKEDAEKRLVNAGIPAITVDRIVAGRYGATPRNLLAQALLAEMAKDGISLADEAAS